MVKYDRFLTIALLILESFYFVLIKGLPEKAAKYPLFILSLMFILTLILGIKSFATKIKENDKKEMFKSVEWKQFSLVLVISLIYIFVIDVFGFFISTFIYLNMIMIGLKANKKISIATSAVFCVLIYIIFVIFLRVPVPSGMLI